MNSEPCVKFGIRISPKIREKPADSRNSSPPNVTLLTVSTSQKLIAAVFPRSSFHFFAHDFFENRFPRFRIMRKVRGRRCGARGTVYIMT